jgi:hypothetical protein
MNKPVNILATTNCDVLRHGYEHVIKSMSSPKIFYAHITTFASEYHQPPGKSQRLTHNHIIVLLNSIWKLGIVGQGKRYFWKLLLSSIFRNPRNLPLAISLMIYGFHFRQSVKQPGYNQ